MKKILLTLLILFIAGGVVGFFGYNAIFESNVTLSEAEVITIPSDSDYEKVVSILEENAILKNSTTFRQVSKLMKYGPDQVPTGKYEIAPKWSNKQLISHLRSGRQKPINVTFNNQRTDVEVLGKIASYLELDSVSLIDFFHSPATLEKLDLDKENLVTLFVPNTYEMFWNVSKEKLLDRLIKEKDKFWAKDGRAKKAEAMKMTKAEVYTLASIVEKESLRKDEKPIIAGVYLNRIRNGIPLQADPTVVFGLKAFDLRRVLIKHLEMDTPYNTYMHAGLPPGPICLPAISSIDAVLENQKHKYLYFCAKPESNGGHLFAESLTQHNANARVYHRWLNSRGIR